MDTLSKSQIKLINSLNIKKFRKKENLFFCEGIKIFETLLTSNFNIKIVFGTQEFADKFEKEIEKLNFVLVKDSELKKISSLTSPQKVFALVEIPEYSTEFIDFKEGLTIVLDKIQDPGNLGTIVRIADWFGIKNIICSVDSVDVYNPKTVQATMGSIFTVKVIYKNLQEFLSKINEETNIYGTFMDGENIYNKELTKNGLIIMGNEANGISPEIINFITQKISIPDFNHHKTAESLNVATATALICSEFKRRIY